MKELSNEQRRQLIDTTQLFEGWREASKEFAHAYRGTMRWQKSKGNEYLVRQYNRTTESLGVRSPETEATKEAYTEARTRLRQRVTRMSSRLVEIAPMNRAQRLGRMPATPARVLRKLDEVGLLGKQLIVVGTHSLFAYEARSGVVFGSELTATTDIDLLVDTRAGMSLAIADRSAIKTEGVIGLLRQVDRSFKRTQDFRAINEDGYYVDIIAPLPSNAKAVKLSELNDDLAAAEIIGLEWLINAPRFEAVIVAEDGLPLWMSCIDPRAFALHKYWVSQKLQREGIKRKRDDAQARAVYQVASAFLNLPFNAKSLTALPLELVQSAKELAAKSKPRRA
jgi:hypothetical protein